MKNKLKFKKQPKPSSIFSEQDFINKVDLLNDAVEHPPKKNVVTFLLRLPEDTKKSLKKFAYENEVHMNQICLDAITQYLSLKKPK